MRTPLGRRAWPARLLLGLTALACLLALNTGLLSAQDIPRLTSAVTDETGVLADSRSQIEDALERLFDRTGVQLYVLFVETTGDMHIADFAAAVGEQNLASTDALLVVALADRADDITIGSGLRDRVSQTALDRVRTQVLEPRLTTGDFGGAVVATADALTEVFAPAQATRTPAAPLSPAPTAAPGQPSEGAGAGSMLLLILGVAFVAIGAIWLVARVRALRHERQRAFEEARTQEQMGREANRLLIATDDALRDAEQELGFVEAEFGAEQSRRLREALATARAELNAAFAIGQKLDDSEPETLEQRRQMIAEIIERCQTVQQRVDAQAAELARLRDLERNAPAVIERLEGQRRQLEGRFAEAEAVDRRLARYAPASTESVAGNLDDARAKFDAAGQRLADSRAALGAANSSAAAVAASEAEDLLEDAQALLEAMAHLAESLDETAAKLPAELAAARADVDA
ncbi:MAG: TPM domain-containing protein, partial [Chloroflexota bacterium]|nr:TPM domain-containing protein [Chloroflexota bacterium]